MEKINKHKYLYKPLKPGDKYTCSWVNNPNIYFILIGTSNTGQATLETPKTKRIITTNINNLKPFQSWKI